MEQLGEERRFASESFARRRRLDLKELERDLGAGQPIARAPDLAHPAGARDPLELEAIGDDLPGVHSLDS